MIELSSFGVLLVAVALLVVAQRRSAALHRTVAEREAAEARARTLFDASPVPTWVIEQGTLRFLEVNGAALRQYGYTLGEFLTLTLRDIRVVEEWAEMEQLLRREQGDLHAHRANHRRKNGTVMEVEIHSHPVTYAGRPARLALVEDVTARSKAERALRESEAQFRAMSDASPAGVAMTNPDGLVCYVNDAALRMLGLPLERALGVGWISGLHPDDRERVPAEWRHAVAARQTYTGAGRFLHADGRVFWWRMRTSPVHSGGMSYGHVAVIIDETEQRSAEEALRESEERFRQLAEHIPAVVYLVEPQSGSMLFISPAYERIWGRTRASLYASPWSFLDAVHDEDRERVQLAYRERLTRLEIEYRITRADGEEVWIEDLQFPIRRADGWIYLVGGLAFDVTRRHRLETQLIESQKMESLGRLAGGVAHDFNNLLTVILSYADLLKDSAGGDADVIAGLTEIETAGHRAASLTRQLLTFARRQVVDPAVIDLNEAMIGIERLLVHMLGERVALTLSRQAVPSLVRIDANQFDQVVLNLAANSRDAMPDGGTLRVETGNARGPVAGTDVPAGAYVTLTVVDSGHGIPADVRSKVFEPFFTTKPKGEGTGLGLSTSYGIVAQFGGHMHLASQVGQGTSVTCFLPVVESESAVLPVRATAGSGVTASETVLIVEDEPMVRDVARHTLERQGYRVMTAANGVEGLRIANEVGRAIDLIVTDIVMPQMGGWEMAEAVKVGRPDAKILFTSGYNEEIASAGGRVVLSVEFLPKPYLPAALTDRVRQVLDQA